MKCNQAKEFLSAYIDKMLDLVARKKLELHRNSCHGCTEELLTLKKYISEVGSLRPVKAPDDFLGKVNDRIKLRFEFEKITRALFIPVKIKLPLEAAGVVLTIVLVVITYRIIEPGINYYPVKKNIAVKKTEPISTGKNIGFIEPLSSKKTVPRLPEINEEPDRKKTMLTSIYSEQSVSKEVSRVAEAVNQEMIAMRTVTKSDSPAKSAGPLAMAGAGKSYDLFVEIKESRLTLDNATYIK